MFNGLAANIGSGTKPGNLKVRSWARSKRLKDNVADLADEKNAHACKSTAAEPPELVYFPEDMPTI
jgi:hypothetical protein